MINSMRWFRFVLIMVSICCGFSHANTLWAASPKRTQSIHPSHLQSLRIQMDRHDLSTPKSDSLTLDNQNVDSLVQPTDSLVQLLDSLGRPIDSLGRLLDSIGRPMDSLGRSLDAWGRPLDSLGRPLDEFGRPLDSLGNVIKVYTESELRQMRRDSIRRAKDSIRRVTPRILTAHSIPDSLKYKRLLVWNTDPYTNQMTFQKPDTSFNDWYTEYPFAKEDVNATYLGLVGSPTQAYNFFLRKEKYEFKAYSPFLTYFPDVDQTPMYNTKTPYTELAYWGTLFAFKEKEESSVRFLHTQNITPAWNIALLYKQFGAKGLLSQEGTDNRGLELTTNYLGERYTLNAGYVRDKIVRAENGGVYNTSDIRDTILDPKTIQINLKEASSKTVRNSLFLNHTYAISLNFNNDSLALHEGTTASIGHSAEWSTYSRFYKDVIKNNDEIGRAFYHDQFYINPQQSSDSIHTTLLDNRVFIRLQPWGDNAIVSTVDGGLGYEYVSNYNFNPDFYLTGNESSSYNNSYVYGNAAGKFRRYFLWDAFVKYYLSGYNQNDYELSANASFAFYPFLERRSPVYIKANFTSSLTEADWYSKHYYSNHYVWNNQFEKSSRNQLEAEISIPKWAFSLKGSYGLNGNYLYHDTTGIIRQSSDLINVLSISLKKNFKLWYFHLDNELLYQHSSNQDVLPLPTWSAHLRYYLEFDVVKNVLTVQAGADATINTKYYAPAYNPALGAFQLQTREKIGDTPYLDVFINMQWKRVSLFLKVVNATNGWPSQDYFSAYGYIRPRRAFKIGIHWPFYYQ